MPDLQAIRAAVAAGNYRYSQHARRQLSFRSIYVREVEEAIGRGEVIEDYPDDKYRPVVLSLAGR